MSFHVSFSCWTSPFLCDRQCFPSQRFRWKGLSEICSHDRSRCLLSLWPGRIANALDNLRPQQKCSFQIPAFHQLNRCLSETPLPQVHGTTEATGRSLGGSKMLLSGCPRPQAETSSRKNPASGLRLANLRLRLCLLQGLKSKDECGCAKTWPNFRDFLRHLLGSKMLEIASAATDPSKFRSFGTFLQWSMSPPMFPDATR